MQKGHCLKQKFRVNFEKMKMLKKENLKTGDILQKWKI